MKVILDKLKTVAPWIVAVGIFTYLFHVYPPNQVWKSIQHVDIVSFTLFCTGYFLFIYLVDSYVTQYVISRFTQHVPMKDMLIARGVTYLIMVVSYPASQAAFAYYFKRRFKIPIFEILSSFLFIMFIDLWWIVSLAFVGSFFQEYRIGALDLSKTVFFLGVAVYAFYAIWISFWLEWPSEKFWRTITPEFIWRQRKRNVFHIFERAKFSDYLRLVAMRIPIHATIILSIFVVVMTFGCHIPFTQVLSNLPLVFLVGTFPITPGGLGTSNAAMVELLKNHLTGPIFATGTITPAELLFSASLLWMFGNYFLKVLTGSILMGLTQRDLFKPTPGEPEEKIEKQALHVGGNL